MLWRLFNAALWSPAGKGLTYSLLFVMFNCVFVTFPCGILGQVWYLIVSIPDLWRFSYFNYISLAQPLFMRASVRELQVQFFTSLLWCGRESNPRPAALKVDAVTN